MLRKCFTIILYLCFTLAIIFFVTLFNQQRYYEMQEKNRLSSFELLLNAKSETNKTCLKYASQMDCYNSFINGLEYLNPRGVVKLEDTNTGIHRIWDHEGHKDDRASVSRSKVFNEFTSKPTVTLLKLTRHQDIYQSSFNAMFFSVLDYTEYFQAKINGKPSSFGNMTFITFTKVVAWGRFYPILPIWIIAFLLLGYILYLIFKNSSFKSSIKKLQLEISGKENDLKEAYSESGFIKKSLDTLHKEMSEKTNILNQEKEYFRTQSENNNEKLKLVSTDKENLIEQINSIKNRHNIDSKESQKVLEELNKQKLFCKKLNERNNILINDITKHISNEEEFKNELDHAEVKLAELENLYTTTKEQEVISMNNLSTLNGKLNNVNSLLEEYKESQNNITHQLYSKEKELNDYISYADKLDREYQKELTVKNVEIENLRDILNKYQVDQDNLDYQSDQLLGTDPSSKKIFNILVKNPTVPVSQAYEYSEPEHHSKAYLKSIHSLFINQKKYKIGNLITDLRGTKFNSKTPNTLKIVEDYAVSPDIKRKGFGLVAVEKSHGYAAYIHLTATTPTEAMLAAKAIQSCHSKFKNYRIIPLNSGN